MKQCKLICIHKVSMLSWHRYRLQRIEATQQHERDAAQCMGTVLLMRATHRMCRLRRCMGNMIGMITGAMGQVVRCGDG
ncbi:MAG: hypothetical protein VXW65_01720 [Pseudomonadota bacterium]|nr:hypothetical protein [Pseudomonadota bacterium]